MGLISISLFVWLWVNSDNCVFKPVRSIRVEFVTQNIPKTTIDTVFEGFMEIRPIFIYEIDPILFFLQVFYFAIIWDEGSQNWLHSC